MATDTSERGLETLLVTGMTEAGWTQGASDDYSPSFGVDIKQLGVFLQASQPDLAAQLDLDPATPAGRKLLTRIQGEITKRGVVDVLRRGVQHGPHNISLYYGTPSKGNATAAGLYVANQFTVTRQLHFSSDTSKQSLDVALFVNGLPVVTFELKNSLTKQTSDDAVEQYKTNRDPGELIFGFKRCIAHFAVDDSEVQFCTQLKGKSSWFLPFNRGWNDGAGNPPTDGTKTRYLWREILTPSSLSNILENYAQVLTDEDPRTGEKTEKQIFPRFHQLDVVRKLLAHADGHGIGCKYLIQHSAGSGKSNSIAWLAHQLIGLVRPDSDGIDRAVFDTVLVVTDRRILDKQIRDTIKRFAQVGATVAHAEKSSDLREALEAGKKIIITTVQKFPFILEEIGDNHRARNFAIVIDEAHSSQSGKTATAMSHALSAEHTGEDEDGDEDPLQDLVNEAMDKRKLLSNASYFAFTATPKNKTLQTFGEPYDVDGVTKHRPFHVYSMKQAVQEGFVLDVLAAYTPVESYYRLVKTVDEDPEYDVKKAAKKLRAFVEGDEKAIKQKAEIIVDHFNEQVIAQRKIGGEARAMVVTGSIERAITYFLAVKDYLKATKSPYQAIVAFSGEPEYKGSKVTETSLNDFPSGEITDRIQVDPYRFLICADKFQTGYDEPLLHTMYVDKKLSGIKAVQTLSRLNRAHPKKHDVFVLDFVNPVDVIKDSFADYYRTTILSDETDANRLHDLKDKLDSFDVYSSEEIDAFALAYLTGESREVLDAILDPVVARYLSDLDEDEQVGFKGSAKAFARTYEFLASVLPYTNAEWEKAAIFFTFLPSKLPAPTEDDTSRGILNAIDMDSYRVEKQTAVGILLPDADAEVDPTPTGSGGNHPEQHLERLSNILKSFNDLFGSINWTDADRISRLITEEIPSRVNSDVAYANAKKQADKGNARIEHDKALERVIISLLADDTELFKQFSDNPQFKQWLGSTVFGMTYQDGAA